MITKRKLSELYYDKDMSYAQIGKLVGVQFQTIGKWMKKYGLKPRPYGTTGLGYRFMGHVLSEETKAKISKKHTGKKLTPEHRAKVMPQLYKRWKDVSYPLGSIVGEKNNKRFYKRIKISSTGDRRKDWKYLHRYLVEKNIGRTLLRSEEVHHINFNTRDNDITNLLVVNRKDHLKLHSQLELVMKELMSRGIVGFDGKQYFVR